MDFERVLKALLQELHQQHIRYAALGGFALGVLKVPRTTMDVDLLVHRDDLGTLHAILTKFGYHRRAQTENVSHYQHAEAAWGGIDILHAFRTYSLAMLARAQSYPIFGTLTINALPPEDVIGYKIQGLANNPIRAAKELVDIESLMAYYRDALDWARIQEYFDLFEVSEKGKQLKERYGHAE